MICFVLCTKKRKPYFFFADTGEFVPKAFYTIDSNGVQSPLSLINPIGVSVLRLSSSISK